MRRPPLLTSPAVDRTAEMYYLKESAVPVATHAASVHQQLLAAAAAAAPPPPPPPPQTGPSHFALPAPLPSSSAHKKRRATADDCEVLVPTKRRRVPWTKPELQWIRQFMLEEDTTRAHVNNRWVVMRQAGNSYLLPNRTPMTLKDCVRSMQKGSYVHSFDIHPFSVNKKEEVGN